jgi:hypothetical protein
MFNIFSTKCKFTKHCNCYRVDDDTCNKERGWFYGIGRGGGCYRSLEESGKESKYYKE